MFVKMRASLYLNTSTKLLVCANRCLLMVHQLIFILTWHWALSYRLLFQVHYLSAMWLFKPRPAEYFISNMPCKYAVNTLVSKLFFTPIWAHCYNGGFFAFHQRERDEAGSIGMVSGDYRKSLDRAGNWMCEMERGVGLSEWEADDLEWRSGL